MNQPKSAMKTTKSNKKRVTISQTVQCVDTLSIYDYTASEIAAAWYDEEAMDKITQRCFKVLQRMESGHKHGTKYCTRGLEGHSVLGSISKRKVRSAAATAVIEEQARQWNENNEEIDFEAISNAYRKSTSSSLMWAQVIGNQDRRAVESYLFPDEEEEDDEVDTTSAIKHTDSPNARIRMVSSEAGMIQKSARAA